MNIFLNFPQTSQFPLSSHDFGQVCGLINKYPLGSNQMQMMQSTKETTQFIFDETDNDIYFII